MKIIIASLNNEKIPSPVFPLGASYIAEQARLNGHEVHIFDACFEENPQEAFKNIILAIKPELIGFSIRNVDNNAFPNAVNYLPYYKTFFEIAKNNSKAYTVIGGSAFSIFPELFMTELSPDYGIKGEGEYEFIDLLKKLEKKEKINEKLIYSPTIKDINFNSFPKREGFDIQKYMKQSGCLNIQTKRGCAFNCSYCTYPVLEGHNYRMRTPESIVDEIEYWYKNQGVDYIFFVDSVFNHPEGFAEKICREIIKRKLKINWTGFFIPKIENKDFFDLCVESGCTGIDFGTDAFSEKTLRGHGKHFTIDDIFRACEICKEKDLKFNHSLILGGPGETMETLKETMDNIDKTEPTAVIAFLGVRVYPGTDIVNLVGDLKIGINPVFYIAEEVKDTILDYVLDRTKNQTKWIIPGFSKGLNPKVLERIRNKGMKGPIWELMAYFK